MDLNDHEAREIIEKWKPHEVWEGEKLRYQVS